MCCEVLVGLAEMMVAEESPVCREGGGVWRLQDQMAGAVDECPFALGVCSPKDEYDVLALFGQVVYDGVGKRFPSPVLV